MKRFASLAFAVGANAQLEHHRRWGEGTVAKCKVGTRGSEEVWGRIAFFQPDPEVDGEHTDVKVMARFKNLEEESIYSVSIYDGDSCDATTGLLYDLGDDFSARRRGRGGFKEENEEICLEDHMDQVGIVGKHAVIEDDLGVVGCCTIEICEKNKDARMLKDMYDFDNAF